MGQESGVHIFMDVWIQNKQLQQIYTSRLIKDKWGTRNRVLCVNRVRWRLKCDDDHHDDDRHQSIFKSIKRWDVG